MTTVVSMFPNIELTSRYTARFYPVILREAVTPVRVSTRLPYCEAVNLVEEINEQLQTRLPGSGFFGSSPGQDQDNQYHEFVLFADEILFASYMQKMPNLTRSPIHKSQLPGVA